MGLFGSLGFSFGKSKSKTKSTTTEDTSQTQSGSSTESSVGTSTTTGSTSTTGASQSTSQQSGVSSTQQQQQQQQVSSNFSAQTLAGLEQFLAQTLGNSGAATEGSLNAIRSANEALGSFDPEAFVQGLVDSAGVNINEDTESLLNQFASNVGGNASTNSAAALLTQRAARDKAAALSGVASQGASQATGIFESLLNNVLRASESGGVGAVSALADVLKGGQSTVQGSVTGSSQTQDSRTDTTNTTQQQQQQNQSTTQETQLVSQIFQQLLDAFTTTKVDSKTKGSTFGVTAG